MTVAALYIDELGLYPKIKNCDAWGQARDARLYAGPYPVVVHAPCGPYSKQRRFYKGNEHDCAPRGLEQVRLWGGVFEHPAESLLWQQDATLREHLGRFGVYVDEFGGYCMAVDQVEWGHVARKRTWLYLVRVPREKIPAPPFPGRQATHWCSGSRTNKTGGSVPPGIKVCSAQQRRRTPPAFAQWLLELASQAKR